MFTFSKHVLSLENHGFDERKPLFKHGVASEQN
jgi:hypothetical protein